MMSLIRTALAAAVIAAPLGAVAEAPGAAAEPSLALVEGQCAADGIPAEACACHRDVFRAEVLDRADTPAAARLAAMIHAMDSVDQGEMMTLVQQAGPGAMDEAARLLMGAIPALEACDDAARAAQRTAEAEAALPQGDDPRTRFVRQCAAENGQVGVCECVADALLESLAPMELALMVDLRAADERGDDAMASLAEERGMTRDEAEQALMMMTGRISAAMLSIDPMACAMAAR